MSSSNKMLMEWLISYIERLGNILCRKYLKIICLYIYIIYNAFHIYFIFYNLWPEKMFREPPPQKKITICAGQKLLFTCYNKNPSLACFHFFRQLLACLVSNYIIILKCIFSFKGHFLLTVIIKYWLIFLCCTLYPWAYLNNQKFVPSTLQPVYTALPLPTADKP